MATLSVLTYNLSQGFKMKTGTDEMVGTASSNANNNGNTLNLKKSQLTKTFSKITVQNVLSENNGNSMNISNNAIVRKIKEFGMFGTLSNVTTSTGSSSKNNITTRKRSLTALKPNNTEKSDDLLNKKPRVNKEPNSNTPKTSKKPKNPNIVEPKPAGTPGRKGLPLPQAVARRNARERNRVKQVNNGFAALRDRIPEEVAEAFETHGSGRGSARKLSKVETLRMAVEYIRSLERLLGYEFQSGDSIFSSGSGSDSNLLSSPENDNSFSLIKDEFDALSPSLDEHFDDSLSNYDVDDYFGNSSGANSDLVEASKTYTDEQTNDLPNITTLNGLQYIRIPGTNTYQLLTDDLFVSNSNSPTYQLVEEEQINNLIDTKSMSPNNVIRPIVSTAPETFSTAAFNAIIQAPASTGNGITSRTTTLMTNASTDVTNGALTQTTTSLSRSSVLQAATLPSSSSPNASSKPLQSSIEQRGKFTQPAMLSPATNELLLQACAMDRLCNNGGAQSTFILQQQQVHIIKQEFQDIGRDYTITNNSNNNNNNNNNNNKLMHSPPEASTLIYQSTTAKQPQQQNAKSLINQTPLAISPPLEGNNSVANMSSPFFTHQNACFQRILPVKNKFIDGLLNTNTTVDGSLSDEGMIEALDWWDQHTPKSENGSANI